MPAPNTKKSTSSSKSSVSTAYTAPQSDYLRDSEELTDSWSEVKNVKRDKYAARISKKQAAAAAAAELKALEEAASPATPSTSAPSASTSTPATSSKKPSKHDKLVTRVEDEAPAGALTPAEQAAQAADKKKKKKKSTTPAVNTADDLVRVLTEIIRKPVPGQTAGVVNVSALGDRLAAATGHKWADKFKKQYGTLKSFLESRNEFQLDGEKVSVRPPKPVETKKTSTTSKQAAKVVVPTRSNGTDDSDSTPSPVTTTRTPTAHTNNKKEKSNKKQRKQEEQTFDINQHSAGIPSQAIFILAGIAVVIIGLGVIKL